jgi:L-xylulokinase
MPVARDLLLGIDVGNTVVKAVLFDFEGQEIARHGVTGKTVKPAPGMVERPVSELWADARAAISGCLEGCDAQRIAAIGLAGHGNGLYLLDRAGAPLLGIQSLDSRAAGVAADLDKRVGVELHGICLQRPWPAQTPALLAWVKAFQPQVYRQAGTLCFAKDIIGFHLSGTRATEISDMSAAGLLRLPEALYDERLLELYGLEDALPLLPKLLQPTDIIGHVTPDAAAATGLTAGTPVVAGYFDVVASALGSGAAGPGAVSIVLGSWSINQIFSSAPARDASVFMVTAFGRDRFTSMDNSATSAANLEWYVRTLIERSTNGGDPFALVNELVGLAPVASADPMFHPFLYGGRHSARQRGGFYGLAGWHDEGHLLRALFEGVAFEHRRHVETLTASGASIANVYLSGGGTRSSHWSQMMADILGLKAQLGATEETGALGGAIAAAVGIGLSPNEEAAVARMTRVRASLRPDPSRQALHDRRFAVWRRLTKTMEAFWTDLAELDQQ